MQFLTGCLTLKTKNKKILSLVSVSIKNVKNFQTLRPTRRKQKKLISNFLLRLLMFVTNVTDISYVYQKFQSPTQDRHTSLNKRPETLKSQSITPCTLYANENNTHTRIIISAYTDNLHFIYAKRHHRDSG